MNTPGSIEQLCDLTRGSTSLRATGGGTKDPLSRTANVSLTALSGVVEYNPQEFTITAQAGTTLVDVQSALAEHGQFLPFDPPLASRGATLGGTLAAGLSGPASFKFGTARDFVIGVRFVTGSGEVAFGGGKVVKNAAGFDFPKLLVGSLGQFGLAVEWTLKVFPRPQSTSTLRAEYSSREQAVTSMLQIAASPVDPMCLDLDEEHALWIRIGGRAQSIDERLAALQAGLSGPTTVADDAAVWQAASEFAWQPPDCGLIKVSGPPDALIDLIDDLQLTHYRLSCGGFVLWFAWPASRDSAELHRQLVATGQRALPVTGAALPERIGPPHENLFATRVLQVLDPTRKLTGPRLA